MDENAAMIQFLDTIMAEIKPLLRIANPAERRTQIQTIFEQKSLTPATYKGFMHDTNFMVWIVDNALQDMFRCSKIWIELVNTTNLIDKIYDLRDFLSHEWLILIIDHDGHYTVYRPLIWAKIQGVKKILNQL